jgi:hypothetical protein
MFRVPLFVITPDAEIVPRMIVRVFPFLTSPNLKPVPPFVIVPTTVSVQLLFPLSYGQEFAVAFEVRVKLLMVTD